MFPSDLRIACTNPTRPYQRSCRLPVARMTPSDDMLIKVAAPHQPTLRDGMRRCGQKHSRAAPHGESGHGAITAPTDRNSWAQPRNRRRADLVGASDVGKRLALVAALDRLALLVIAEFERSAHFLPARNG